MKVKLSGNLARFVNYKKELVLATAGLITVHDALLKLVETYPALKDIVFDKAGRVKNGYLISLNGQRVDPNTHVEKIAESDCIDVFTAIAGG